MEASPTPLSERLTASDLDRLPHEWDTRYELIGGVLYISRRQSFEHQELIARLLISVGGAVQRIGGRAIPEPGIVWEQQGQDNVVPDLAILIRTPIPPRGEKLHVCPEVIVEVLSAGESNQHRDLQAKAKLYWDKGASEYWILDPEAAQVRRRTRGAGGWEEQQLSGDARLSTPLVPGWEGIRIGELFGG